MLSKAFLLQSIIAGILVSCVFAVCVNTVHWPVVGDASLMKYVIFLIDHGMAPYKDIWDINLPGTYILQAFAIHDIGASAVAWRLFDFSLCLVIVGSMIYLSVPVHWLAGFAAGSLFFLLHVRDGLMESGQRDLMMTAFIFIGAALSFRSLRTGSIFYGAFAGICFGLAAIVKPTAIPIAILFGAVTGWRLRGVGKSASYAILSVGGLLLPAVTSAIYLWRHAALRAFITLWPLIEYHNALGRLPLKELLFTPVASVLYGAVLLALPAAVESSWLRTFEGKAISVALLLSCLSYWWQGKGFLYHRYPATAFLLLLVGTVVAESLTTIRPHWVRIASWLAVADLILFVAPVSVAAITKYEWRNNDFQVSLTRQLRSLGAASGDTQCLDTFAGCLAALDEVGIRQSSGLLYDCYLFSEPQRPATLLYRERFWSAFRSAPPRLLVMTDNDCFSHELSFDRLKRWSLFADYVGDNYTEILQYTPSRPILWWRHPQQPYSYRIYLRKMKER